MTTSEVEELIDELRKVGAYEVVVYLHILSAERDALAAENARLREALRSLSGTTPATCVCSTRMLFLLISRKH
jgi:hypothetical protein